MSGPRRLRKVGAFLCAICQGVATHAQTFTEPRAEFLISVEAKRDRAIYHFDNPSTFDTAALVPHFFEQRYNLDTVWAVLTARYAAGPRWETSLGVTPSRTTTADDYDTFFDPDGTVWIAGTTGAAAVHSFRVSQSVVLGRRRAVRFDAGFRLTLDFADFHVGHKTVTRNGVLMFAADASAPEFTQSQLREAFVRVESAVGVGKRWTLTVDGEAAPLAVGRLSIQLPEKYPGQDIVFSARLVAAQGRLTLCRCRARWPVVVGVDAARTWSYQSAARLSRNALGARVAIGRSWD